MSRLDATDWDLVRGDDFDIRLQFADAAGAALNVSAWTFTGQVRTDPDAAATLGSFTFDLAAAATGVVDAALAAAVTATFTGRFVYYDIQAVTNAGKKKTYMFGRLNVIKDVTKP